MKAIVYLKKSKPEPVVLCEIEKPVCGDNQVLVRVHNASVNAADSRSLKLGILPNGRIMGSDVAGEIVVIGKNVTNFQIGDRVAGDLSGCGYGSFAEYVAADANVLAHIPPNVSFETAAAVPMAAVTALQAMRNTGNIQAGQKVLICGAGGGVGTFAVQLAKHFGAEVTAVCGKKNVATMKKIGADHVIDYTVEDFAKSSQRFDLVLVLNGNRSLSSYRKVMSPKSTCVMSGGSLTQLFKCVLLGPFISLGAKKMRLLSAKPNAEDLAYIMRQVEAGQVIAVIDQRYQLHEVAKAVSYLIEGHAGGKVIITVDEP